MMVMASTVVSAAVTVLHHDNHHDVHDSDDRHSFGNQTIRLLAHSRNNAVLSGNKSLARCNKQRSL